MIASEDPILVFLMETKLSKEEMTKKKYTLGFTKGLVVGSNGSKGGLALLWRKEVRVDIQTFGPWHIDVEVGGVTGTGTWRFTGFYGQPDTSKREETWRILERLGNANHLPWLCMGDFNEIVSDFEKLGGNLRSPKQMERFRDAINRCRFRDLGYVGPRFTWNKIFTNGDSWWVQLDRALATTEWFSNFANAKLHHLSTTASDHCILALRWNQREQRRNKGVKPFRFEAMWFRDPTCAEVVSDAWEFGLDVPTGHPLLNCISSCNARLTQWNKREFSHIGNQIKALRYKLQALETTPKHNMDTIRQVRQSLNGWLDIDEVMWKQRLRINFLKEGDRNTSFFHTKALNRKQRNWIQGLEDENGLWQEGIDEIEYVATQYFSTLFTSS